MIDINQTLILQIIGFFLLLYILNKLLYRPLQDILEERERRISGTLGEASDIEEEVRKGLIEYERRIKEAASLGHEERNRLRQEGLKKEQEILEQARAKASKELERVKKDIEKGKEQALGELRNEAKAMSKNIAEKILGRTVAALFFLFILPAVASASSGEHAEGGLGFWKIFNFLVLAVGVYFAWTKVIKGELEKRSDEIKKAIDEAAKAKQEAERKAEEYREKLKLLDSRVEKIKEELRLEGEAEKERIIKEAEESAVRLMEQTKLAAETELKKAKIALRNEVARLSVKMAGELLSREIKDEDQERLARTYLDNLRSLN